ncbi:SELENOF [Branchiostoma lanceolatum]|uniref:Selenoprotein F n=1 Tax=Branchiostoma lanceolatum TaxID=7740 RepID=A0A8K0EZ06_BRALA|nr:SELENOF [Branchiostoma lanceolatum]
MQELPGGFAPLGPPIGALPLDPVGGLRQPPNPCPDAVKKSWREHSFVKSDRPKQFPGLKVKYVRGADPILKMLDHKDQVVETLSIEKWNTDNVEEFLSEKLQKL